MNDQQGRYVQFGCGLCAPAGWENFDASPTLALQRVPLVGPLVRSVVGPSWPENVRFADARKGLPGAAGSCAAVYCSHVLEHLPLDDFRATLRSVLRSLRPGGTFRFVVPDLEHMVAEYTASSSPTRAQDLVAAMRFAGTKSHRSLSRALGAVFGWAGHRSMWDYAGLHRELADAGFVGMRRAFLGDNPDPQFRAVEDPGRWGAGTVGVECTRP
jgi:predicted SAM-dependent methyltransferase